VQTTNCYSSAGPTGSKNCHNWENLCTALRTDCGSSNPNGPPSLSSYEPAPLGTLDQSKVVAGTGQMGSSAPSSSGSSAAAPAYSSAATAMPAPASPSAVAAGSGTANSTAYGSTWSSQSNYTANGSPGSGTENSTANGSIDTCGSNGGLTCMTGMCCSAHG